LLVESRDQLLPAVLAIYLDLRSNDLGQLWSGPATEYPAPDESREPAGVLLRHL
jgi:hypothetical protein